MGAEFLQSQGLTQLAQAVAGRVGHKDASHLKGVDSGVVQGQVMLVEKPEVKAHIVPDHRVAAHKAAQPAGHLRKARSASDVGVGDARQLLDLDRHGTPGIDGAVPGVLHTRLNGPIAKGGAKADGSDLQDGIALGVQACCLQIQGHVCSVHGAPF